MKQNIMTRSKPTQIQSINIQQEAKSIQGGNHSTSINGVGKTGQQHAKTGPHTKINPKMEEKLEHKT